MNSSALKPFPPSSVVLTNNSNPNWKYTRFNPCKTGFSLKSLDSPRDSGSNRCLRRKFKSQKPEFSASCLTAAAETPYGTSGIVGGKLQRLASEFASLTEPIDRVKRLLSYAEILPPFEESARLPANRVTGCTTQVWLDARIDEFGKMRFKADSDSEITKGFCSCLIWMLDGGKPEEVLEVRSEDLTDMNVGVHGKAQSRVNTWHNVLIGMQKRTRALLAERKSNAPLVPFPSLVVTSDGFRALTEITT
ncbi:sufE-like protein 2, chloroplastic [Carica papaya]|uniref:sufE-like protein 2, chloroplastic n=1 Tax=Carica papaya TaxID=3649 RepID=UPI000B8CD4E1|nr:sufE-like protein 2, chloroplastic [Carica papaya]